MTVPMVDVDATACPSCGDYVRPFETVELGPTATGLVVDQGEKELRRYRHCDQTWERTVQRPPRWSSSPGH